MTREEMRVQGRDVAKERRKSRRSLAALIAERKKALRKQLRGENKP
jgi:hypothetical protein